MTCSLKPLAQSLLYVVLRECALLLGVFEAMAHFVEDVEVVLDVLKRAVLGELVQEGFDLLFGGRHYEVRIALRPQIPGLAKAARPFDCAQGKLWGTRLKRSIHEEQLLAILLIDV